MSDWLRVLSNLYCVIDRGCTSVEQSIVGGCAHLLSFNGSDTMSAGYYAQVWIYITHYTITP